MSEQVEMFVDMSDNENTNTKGGESDSVEIFESHEDRDFDGVEVLWGVEDIFLPGGVLSQHLTGYELRQPQLDLAVAMLEGLDKGHHVVAEGPTGCHVAGQEILMFDGSVKKVEDIVVGDQLMGPDSRPRGVLSLARGRENIVEVVPVKGEPWRVNESHILSLVRTNTRTKRERHRSDYRSGEIVDVKISDWRGWSKTFKHLYKLFRVGVSFEPNADDFAIWPYHLGMLLGDGSFLNGVSVTASEEEVVKEIHTLAIRFGLDIRVSEKKGCATYYLSGMVGSRGNSAIEILKRLGLYNREAGEKFIPFNYKTASRDGRLELLAGLIDTDGSYNGGGYDCISKSRQLVIDIAFVARSLGFAAYVSECEKGYGEFSGTYYRTFISGDGINEVPCRIKRKRATERKQKKSVLRTGFKIVDLGFEGDYFGFTLSGDGRYLLGDFTVTHNTGKTLAYLVPAIKRVLESSGKDARVVIGTSNIALQEQLIKKDLPFLKDILEPGFNFALVKGINNYYCHRTADKMKIEYGQGILPTGENPSDYDISKFYSVFPGKVASICRWAEDSESGDKSELTFEPSQEDWGLVSTTSDECIGSSCRFAEKCFVKRARKALQDTHVIVVNYHLLFAAIAVRKTTGKDIILPPFKYLICDEAHRIPGIARGFFGWNISEVRVNRAIVQFNKRLRDASRKGALLPDEVGRGERWSEETSSQMEGFWKKVNKRYGPTRGALRLRQQGEISAVSSAENLLEMSEMMSSAAKGLGKEAGAEALKLSQSLRAIGEALEDVSMLSDPNGVYYIEKFGKYNKIRICKRLMDVSGLLWQDMICHTTSTIATSATMAIEGNCEYVKGEMGMKESLDIVVSSPFDYKKQALMVLSANAPDPTQKESYPDKVARIVEVVIQHAKGRTLCLFTSYRVLKHVAAHLAVTTSCSYPILVQGDAPRMQLIDKFKTVEDSVLLGTESFWTGVDVPGPSLSCLLIDKIPFPTPGDPVLDALQEAAGGFHKSFWKISVPRAVLQLRQGVGRLIRSRNDKGVLVILDNRLVTKGYGSVFTDSLPPMRRGSGIRNGEITKWLES